MPAFDLAVVGGSVWTARGFVERTDILVRGEQIVELRPSGVGAVDATEVVDATDRLVIPGLIDTHTHQRDPGFTHKERHHQRHPGSSRRRSDHHSRDAQRRPAHHYSGPLPAPHR